MKKYTHISLRDKFPNVVINFTVLMKPYRLIQSARGIIFKLNSKIAYDTNITKNLLIKMYENKLSERKITRYN